MEILRPQTDNCLDKRYRIHSKPVFQNMKQSLTSINLMA